MRNATAPLPLVLAPIEQTHCALDPAGRVARSERHVGDAGHNVKILPPRSALIAGLNQVLSEFEPGYQGVLEVFIRVDVAPNEDLENESPVHGVQYAEDMTLDEACKVAKAACHQLATWDLKLALAAAARAVKRLEKN
jgi:hypothetical protein